MQKYVLGFCFDSIGNGVVLIEKKKPAWQAGLHNGVGGKVEELEHPGKAMVREFFEETGVQTSFEDWTGYATIHGPEWTCDCYYMYDTHAFAEAKTMTEEKIVKVLSTDLPDCISNLQWLIPMAKNHHDKKDFLTDTIYY